MKTTALAVTFLLASFATAETISVWGAELSPDTIAGALAVADAFEKKHPGVHVRMLGLGAGDMNPQKLLTAIVGGSPPDVVRQSRFTISDWASRGAFIPLDPYLERDRLDQSAPHPKDYYSSAWLESTYQNAVYGIPTEADDRALYWNRGLFKQEAKKLRAAGLDPTRPPRTWSEIISYSKVLTIPGKRVGFLPNFGNSWLYLYAFQNNASFMSPDGTTCTLDSPQAVEALELMKKGYDVAGGYEAANAFQSSFRPNENDPFLTGQVAMKIDGDWSLPGIARYGPNLDFGVAPPPVPDDRYNGVGAFKDEKDKFITWTGGFCYVIPKGAKNQELAWEFIKFASSLEGRMIDNRARATADRVQGRLFLPRIQALKKANEALLQEFEPADPKFRDGLRTHFDLMNQARFRPPTIVGQLLWDEHVKATETVMLGKLEPKRALQVGEATVQRELDRITSKNLLPIVPTGIVEALALLLLIGCAACWIYVWKKARLTTLAKKDAWGAYLMISPWIIGLLLFTADPMISSFFMSFTSYDVMSPPRWIGVNNYLDIIGPNRTEVTKAFANAAYLAGFGIPLGMVSGLAIAVLLNTGVKGMRIYRTIYYLPAIVPVAASAVLWIWLLSPDPNQGLVSVAWQSTIGTWMNWPIPGWLTAENWAKPSLILMGIWGAGSGMILWLAGLKGVPQSLYEAADIDGASATQIFRKITLPMLSPILFFNAVMGMIGALQEFDRIYIMAGGGNGPGDSLLVPAKYVFTNAFAYFKFGYASAVAWVIFAVVMIVTILQFRIARHWVYQETSL